MASLGTLRPGIAEAWAGTVPFDSAPDNCLADDSDSTYGEVTTNSTDTYTQLWTFPTLPSDFDTLDTLNYQVRYGWDSAPSNTTWDSIGIYTESSSKASVYSALAYASSITNTSPVTGPVTDAGLVGGPYTKAQLEAAFVRIDLGRTRSKGGDSNGMRVYEVWITGTYTATGGGAVDTFAAYVGGGYYPVS